jgi:hypothetical protein
MDMGQNLHPLGKQVWVWETIIRTRLPMGILYMYIFYFCIVHLTDCLTVSHPRTTVHQQSNSKPRRLARHHTFTPADQPIKHPGTTARSIANDSTSKKQTLQATANSDAICWAAVPSSAAAAPAHNTHVPDRNWHRPPQLTPAHRPWPDSGLTLPRRRLLGAQPPRRRRTDRHGFSNADELGWWPRKVSRLNFFYWSQSTYLSSDGWINWSWFMDDWGELVDVAGVMFVLRFLFTNPRPMFLIY